MGRASGLRDCFAAGLAAGLVACGGLESGGALGVVRVATSTTGPSPDPDGYTVAVDGGIPQPIGAVDELLLPPLDLGDHRIELRDLAGNCVAPNDSTRSVTVAADDTAEVRFEVTCGQAEGAVEFVSATSGEDADPNGYVVELGPGLSYAIPPNGVYSASVPAGVYAPAVSGATPNCTPAEAIVPQLEVTRGGLARVRISYQCGAAAPAGAARELAFVTGRNADEAHDVLGQVFVMNEDGTAVRAFAAIPGRLPIDLVWTRDGRGVLFAALNFDTENHFSAVYRLDPETGVITPIGLGVISGRGLAVSPDGSRLAYTDNANPTEELNQVVVSSPDGSNAQQISSPDAEHHSPTWSPDGGRVAFVRQGLGETIVVATLGTPGEQPAVAGFPADLQLADLAWSPAGEQIAFQGIRGRSVHLYLADLDAGEVRQLTSGPGGESRPTWSPDGEQLAFSSDRDGNSEIYVMNADGSNLVRVTNNPAFDGAPAWRP